MFILRSLFLVSLPRFRFLFRLVRFRICRTRMYSLGWNGFALIARFGIARLDSLVLLYQPRWFAYLSYQLLSTGSVRLSSDELTLDESSCNSGCLPSLISSSGCSGDSRCSILTRAARHLTRWHFPPVPDREQVACR